MQVLGNVLVKLLVNTIDVNVETNLANGYLPPANLKPRRVSVTT